MALARHQTVDFSSYMPVSTAQQGRKWSNIIKEPTPLPRIQTPNGIITQKAMILPVTSSVPIHNVLGLTGISG